MKKLFTWVFIIAGLSIIIFSQVVWAEEKTSEQVIEELEELKQRLEALENEKNSETGLANWTISGYAHVGYQDAEDGKGSFTFGSFSPIFLFQLGDDILFEAELELELEDGETEVKLEYAQIDWSFHDNATLVAGNFLSPFNIFQERLHPAWINKLPTMPLMYQHHGGFLPTTELGVQLRGGINFGSSSKVEYSLYLVNGPTLAIEGHEAGSLEFGENFSDNNDNKAFGFRLNVLPIPHLDLGGSYMFAKGDDLNMDGTDIFGLFVSAQFRGLDLKVEWARMEQDLSDAVVNTLHPTDADELTEFKDEFEEVGGSPLEKEGFYIQAAYRLEGIPDIPDILSPIEVVIRYEETDLPGKHDDQEAVTFGLNYWLRPNLVFKIAYESSEEEPKVKDDTFYLQAAYGF